MALTLSKIASNTGSVIIPVGEDTVTVVYYPGRITEKSMAQMQAFSTMEESNLAAGFAGFNEMLCHLIKSWDVYEDDLETVMFPLEPERLAELPIMFRVEVVNAIVGDIRPEAVAPQLNGHS